VARPCGVAGDQGHVAVLLDGTLMGKTTTPDIREQVRNNAIHLKQIGASIEEAERLRSKLVLRMILKSSSASTGVWRISAASWRSGRSVVTSWPVR
jgi:hypothetical protein